MTLRLDFVKETEKARLYSDAAGEEFWVPKSVITHTTKYPQADALRFAVHEVTIEDWWWDKHEGLTDDEREPWDWTDNNNNE